MAKEHIYYVRGMHCAACEVLIEKKVLEISGVKSVEASTGKGQAVVEYEGEKPTITTLNEIFQKDNYTFFDDKYKVKEVTQSKPVNATLAAFTIAIFVVIGFLLLENMGVSGLLNVTSTSSLFAFLGFGLLAGLSSCAALVGGMVLSMSKQWQELYLHEQRFYKKLQPHILFNVGRIVSYSIGGGILGLIGSRFPISLNFTSFLVIAISLLMMGLALQMLEVKGFRSFQFSMPRFITRRISNEHNFKGKYMPFIMGAATFLLPCGFTITIQTIALLSGSMIQGALMTGFFALGTAPMLLCIGLSSVKFFSRPHWANTFSKVAGFLVLFFALFTISNQMNVLGINVPNLFLKNQHQSHEISDLAPVIDGKQVIKMTVLAVKYDANYFKVKAGIPVRWEITSSGQPGCDNGVVIARGLTDPIYLNPNQGQITIKEFTPQYLGTYTFTCPMGMVKGTIEVIN